MAVSGHDGRSVLQPGPESARRRLDLVDDEEAGEHGAAVEDRDGNGDPIPDSPRGIPPLGDGDGEETSPAGI